MKKILIADDEPDILKIVQFRLIKAGYKVIMAVNGQEALELIGAENPDLILLDVSMPLVKGDEVCKRIKADGNLKHIPVILMTASTQAVSKEDFSEIGAEGFILKPFEADDFFKKVKEFID